MYNLENKMSKKLVIYCSYNEKLKVSSIKFSPLYIKESNQWRLNYLNEIIEELQFEKDFILNNLNAS